MPSCAPLTVRPLADDADAVAFSQLNRHWITEHFTITAEDERVLSDPRGEIVAGGGEVLVAEDESGAVVGVVALLAAGPGVFELAKMTVATASRGRGVGGQLIGAAVGWAVDRGAERVFLGTSTLLPAAIRLYERAEFEPTTLEDLGLENYYSRADVLMKRELRR